MRIADIVFHVDHGGYPYISAEIDGYPAIIYMDGKPLIEDMGYVLIWPSDEWIPRLPPQIIPADHDDGREALEIRGYMYSPELVAFIKSIRKRIDSPDDDIRDGQKINYPDASNARGT